MTFVNERRCVRDLSHLTAGPIEQVGLMCRVFARLKSDAAITEKIQRKNYEGTGRLMQDLIGVRITSYFFDDLEIVRDLLGRRFGAPVDEVKDAHSKSTFQPVRWNLVFRVPGNLQEEIRHVVAGRPIDTTFEVQLRTVLAEGWHEVEHDLRYKRPRDWDGEEDMSRTLNGLLATLESADWTMLQLFERLAYQKYKDCQWESMLRMHLRLRLSEALSADLSTVIGNEPQLAKRLLRTDRSLLVRALALLCDLLPLTINNVVFTANRLSSPSSRVIALEPTPVKEALEMTRTALELALSGRWHS